MPRTIATAQLTRDLGGTDGDRLLMHCKKLGCDFKDILTASGITPGHVEIDQMAAENARREREAEAARS